MFSNGKQHGSVTTATVTQTAASAPAATTTSGGKVVDYVPLPVPSLYSVALDCPNIDGQRYTTTGTDQVFTISCNVGLNGGDIAYLLAYTIDKCIEACASVN